MDFIKPIIFFDLETTGVSITQDRICQVGAIKIFPDGMRETKNVLINPEMVMSDEVIAIHNITNEMVADKPKFKQVAASMLKWFSGCDLAGYNTDAFDIPFLCEEFARCGLKLDLSDCAFIDVLKVERKVNPHNLGDTYKRYFGKEMEGAAHDALVDTQATLEVFLEQCKKNELGTIAELDKTLQGDNERFDFANKMYIKEGQVFWNFGKERDKLVKETKGYANWVLKGDFPSDTKEKIRKLIK